MTQIKRTILAGGMALVLGVVTIPPVSAAELALTDTPLYLDLGVDPNVLFNMSVETPMGGAAYNDQPGTPAACGGRANNVAGQGSADNIGTCYFNNVEYIGYFDPWKCYDYSNDRFYPKGATNTLHQCSGHWSGNFLNWATMTAIDEFIWTMTGGYRIDDTTSETVIRRARKQNNNSWFPIKVLDASINVAPSTVTPYSESTMFIYNTDFGIQLDTNYNQAKGGSPDKGPFFVRAEVCNASEGLEANCVAYGGGSHYKPEGLVQLNAASKRFAVTSYTFDSAGGRHGGVLRSNMKHVGPTRPIAGGGGFEPNPATEWDSDGILIHNPDGAGGGLNSGVINYINQFSTPGYKGLDPVSELYYETLRYFKNLGPTSEYAAGLPAGGEGGFQIVSSWEDPIQAECQQSFIVGINDANPWLDKKLPGTAFMSQFVAGYDINSRKAPSGDWGEPSNSDPDINVKSLTDQVGVMENAAGGFNLGAFRVGGGASNLDRKCTAKNITGMGLGGVMGTCSAQAGDSKDATRDNTYYVAGLAYYANTTDLRTDHPGDQTISTFMIDTQEYNSTPNVGPTNPLWLVGKYGGFIDENGNNEPDLASEWDADGDGEPDNYVLASAPQKLIDGLNAAFIDIDERTASGAAVALNSGSLEAGSRLYQGRFTSGAWIGQVLAYDIDPSDGSVVTPEAWDAAPLLATRVAGNGWNTNRKIITYNGTSGIPFRWASLTSGMQGDLNTSGQGAADLPGSEQGDKRLEYLRGSEEHEGTGNNYRKRENKNEEKRPLGDIVNGAPAYIRVPPFNYPDGLEGPPPAEKYSDFKSTHNLRAPMIYVGANDGMLHGFDGDTGEEMIAYVPSSVFPNLTRMTSTNYTHSFYVDGAPTVGDAFWNNAWHTVVAGGLNKGGQGIYALDVTNPSTFNESTASNLVLWEFTDADDSDLGYTYSRPAIVRMANNKWAAVFGNGYNNTEADGNPSTSGNAVLYIAFIQDGLDGTWTLGSDFIKIDTGAGSAATPNGLATVSPVDVDGDRTIDYIYGGDLLGKLWKFDVTNSSPGSWGIAPGGNPLFTATDDSGVAQPITTRPEVGSHPDIAKTGYMVYFGTGKYLESGDNSTVGTQTQTFYGIWDPDTATAPPYDRNGGSPNLLEQRIEDEITAFGAEVRIVSDNTITWASDANSPSGGEHIGWYIDLKNWGGSPVANNGERQVTTSVLSSGRIIFSTLIPSASTCVFGGDGWIMELDSADGSRLDEPPFDLDNDGDFDLVDDGFGNFVAPGGTKSTGGAPSSPAILDAGNGQEYKYISGTDGGSIQVISEQGTSGGGGTGTRESWQQLR